MGGLRGLAYWLLRRVVPADQQDVVLGDLEEEYAESVLPTLGRFRATGWYVAEVCSLVWSFTLARHRTRLTDKHGYEGRGARGLGVSGVVRIADLRYALGQLYRTPAFSLATVLVLAGGLALSIFTFSFLYAVMFKPLPFSEGREVVRVVLMDDGGPNDMDAADFASMRGRIETLSEIGIFSHQDLVLGGDDGSRMLYGTYAESNVFEFARTPLLLGRGFSSEEHRAGSEAVVVLGFDVWRDALGGDSAAVGRTVALNGVSTRIIGVAAPGFGFPLTGDAWMPMPEDVLEASHRGQHLVSAYGRLALGRNRAAVNAELAVLWAGTSAAWTENGVDVDSSTRITATTFQMAQMAGAGPMTFAFLNVMAGLILVLACTNVTNLLLTRANERSRETAIRLALGASRGRLFVQSMWETVIICLIGGTVAVVLASWGLTVVNRWAQANIAENLAYWWSWGPDGSTFLAAMMFVAFTIATLGVVVGRRVSSAGSTREMRSGTGAGRSLRAGRVSAALVIVQVAIVTALMFFGGVTGFIAHRFTHPQVGVEIIDRLVATITLDGDSYTDQRKRTAYTQRVLDVFGGVEGIRGVAIRSTVADPKNVRSEYLVDVGGEGAGLPRARIVALAGNWDATGISLRAGRVFDQDLGQTGEASVLVSESLARRHWPDGQAVGRRLRVPAVDGPGMWRTIVGIVDDAVIQNPLTGRRSPMAIYLPLRQMDVASLTVVVHHTGDPAAALSTIQRNLSMVDPLLVPDRIYSIEEILDQASLFAKSTTRLFAACFAFALLLAVSGIYALTARSVAQQTREIGVRRALGADNGRIVRLLLRQSGKLLGIGIGVASPLLFSVAVIVAKVFSIEPRFYVAAGAGVLFVVMTVMLYAVYVPARRVIVREPCHALWHGS